MTDHFAALHQPRRPWLDVHALKDHFHKVSATCHPDVPGSGDAVRFAEVNAAHSALRDTVWRLRHLLELEAPEKLGGMQAVPSEFSDLFMRLADVRQAIQAFQKKENAAGTGLARALLAEERLALWERITALKAELDEVRDVSLSLLRTLDAEWDAPPSDATDRLAALHQRFSYLSKWRAQLGESLFNFQANT